MICWTCLARLPISLSKFAGEGCGFMACYSAIRKASMSASNFERYQRIAWAYDLLDLPFEYGRYRKIRPLLFRGLSGRILEAGVGTGRHFPFYPPTSEVVGIDLSPAMLARAERKRSTAAAN